MKTRIFKRHVTGTPWKEAWVVDDGKTVWTYPGTKYGYARLRLDLGFDSWENAN